MCWGGGGLTEESCNDKVNGFYSDFCFRLKIMLSLFVRGGEEGGGGGN